MTTHITQNVLWLNVSMANSLSVNIGNAPHQLVRIELDNQIWDLLFHLVKLFHDSISSVWDIVHDHVEIHFIGLVSVGIEALSHLNTVGVVKHLQDGQLSVLVSFVLEHFLDSNCFSGLGDGGLENHSKRAISYDFFSVICKALKSE